MTVATPSAVRLTLLMCVAETLSMTASRVLPRCCRCDEDVGLSNSEPVS